VTELTGTVDARGECLPDEPRARVAIAERQEDPEAMETPTVEIVKRFAYEIVGRRALGCARIGRRHVASECGLVRFGAVGAEVYSVAAIVDARTARMLSEPCPILDNRLKWPLAS
jgi:hypothetical protein